jgi:hypothetical protein
MTTVTLTKFLLACIAEDEAHASLVTMQSVDMNGGVPQIRHTAIRVRVLAECEAKRRIVELHTTVDGAIYPTCDCCGLYGEADVDWPCPTLRLLALPYADRPGYRAEWRP